MTATLSERLDWDFSVIKQNTSSFRARLFGALVSALNQITRPHESIQDEETRQGAQLLSGLLITTIVVVSVIIVLVVHFDSDDLYDLRTTAGFAVIAVAVVLQCLNRCGYSQWATFGFVATLTLILIATPYVGNFPEFLAFAVVPMLLVGMFFRFRWAVASIVALIVVVFVLNSLYIDETIWERRILWYFLIFAGALVLAFKGHLNQLEVIRRRKLDEANTHLRATLNAIPDCIFEIDGNEHLIDYRVSEDFARAMLLETFLGRSLLDAFSDDTACVIRGAINEAAKTGRYAGAVFSLELADQTQWFEVSISAKGKRNRVDEDLRFVVVARNITERMQAEFLRTERARLEVALEKEKELVQLRSQLISLIAHEFRTPLSIILISSSLLVDYADQLSPANRNERIQSIVNQVKRLDAMLDDVNTLSKSQRGFLQYQPQPTDIVKFCEQLVSELKSISSPNNTLTLIVQEDFARINLDTNLLRHALTNLISNAMKYSPNGGVITLEVNGNDDSIVLSVSDEGIGIPPEDMQHLFQPFHRASNVENIHGTGLGLSIVKEAVDLQGGEITCESQVGVGTTFTICIPAR